MSDQTTTSRQNAPTGNITNAPQTQNTPQLTPQQIEWSAKVFREKGWKSKSQAQRTMLSDLKPTIETALGGMFPSKGPGSADSMDKLLTVNVFKHTRFRAYRKALGDYEKARGGKNEGKNAELVRAAAAEYVTHSKTDFDQDELDDNEKRQKRLQACLKTLSDLRREPLLQRMQKVPWDSETAMAAASLKAEADLASLPTGQQFAQQLAGDGVNPTFWINKNNKQTGQPEKTYLFKPATDKGDDKDRDTIPNGGEPAREALSGRAADILGVMAGIDFKLPETQIVEVSRERFQAAELGDEVVDKAGTGPLVGSLQQFAPNSTQMRKKPPAMKYAVPDKRCQELAILDITMLHVDRHGGNYMMTGDDQAADLIPIDNGLAFPEGTKDLSRFMATSHNSMLQMPGAHKPFSPDMLGKIDKINPKVLEGALKGERDAIEAVHGSAQGMLSDAALAQSARSTAFLKLAAPTLSPAAVQVALGRNAAQLLDPKLDEQTFAAVATRIIDAMATDQKEVANYFLMTKEEAEARDASLKQNGWAAGDVENPVVAMKLFKSGAVKPPAMGSRVDDWDGQNNQAQMQPAIAEMKKVFPKANDNWVTTWIAFEQLGGMRELEKAKDQFGVPTTMNDSVIRNPSLKGCYAYLIYCQTITAATANVDERAGNNNLIMSKMKLLKSMHAVLDPKDAGAADQSFKALVTTLRSVTADAGLVAINKERDALIGKAQPWLAQRLTGLPPSTDQAIIKNRKDAEAAIETGSVIAASEIIAKLAAALNPGQGAQSTTPNSTTTMNPAPNQTSNTQPVGDDETDAEELRKLLETVARARKAPGGIGFAKAFDAAEDLARNGRIGDANKEVRRVLATMMALREKIEALKSKMRTEDGQAVIATVEQYFLDGHAVRARDEIAKLENAMLS